MSELHNCKLLGHTSSWKLGMYEKLNFSKHNFQVNMIVFETYATSVPKSIHHHINLRVS